MATFHGYVHVPFCRVRCGYCDFNTYTATELQGFPQSAFISNLRAEVKLARENVGPRELETVFFGGGTPTLLPANELAEALSLLREAFGIADGAEVTTEANPDTVDRDYLSVLKDAGFNRLSFGMQSAVPEVLAVLDRTHNPDAVARNVAIAKGLGFQTSVDLIYGAPGETMDQWKQTVQAALSLDTNHISAYALIVEPATKLARQIAAGALPAPDEDLQADKYEYLDAILSENGFDWYELSNWSKAPNSVSEHNIAYWKGQDWWGFGPGAHSHIEGRRWSNVKHPTTYAKHLALGELPSIDGETLSEKEKLEERAMLELRLRAGLDLQVIRKLNMGFAKSVSELVAAELIEGSAAISGRAILTLKGRLLADFVLRKLLDL
ncbi:MAG: radical SAM family heme chaperone HemW [Micrococcales bacterium]